MTFPMPSLDRLAELGFDWVWFLSVWQTGLAGQRVSRSQPRMAQGISGDAAGLAGRGHRRVRVRDHRLHRASATGRGCGPGPPARTPAPAWPALAARFCPQPHRPGSSLGGGTSRVLHRWNRTGPGSGAAELYLGQAPARRPAARPRARSVLSRLAGHPAAQLRQSGHAGSDDRGVGEDRRAV